MRKNPIIARILATVAISAVSTLMAVSSVQAVGSCVDRSETFDCPPKPAPQDYWGNVCGIEPDFYCSYSDTDVLGGCAANQTFNCETCLCQCNTASYPCAGCTAPSSVPGTPCSPPINGVYQNSCGTCGCPSGTTLCSSTNTCVANIACPAGTTFDPCTGSCSSPYILRSPASTQSGDIDISGFINMAGDLWVGGNATVDNDVYMANGKSIRVDGAGYTQLNVGNYTGSAANLAVQGWSSFAHLNSPGYPIDLRSGSSTAVINLKDDLGTLYTGIRLARGGVDTGTEKWFMGMNGEVDGNLRFSSDKGLGCLIDDDGNLSCDGTVGGSGLISGSGSDGAVTFWNGSNSLGADADNLFWDDTTNRLGIGTSTPSGPGVLHVSKGSVTLPVIMSSNTGMLLTNSAGVILSIITPTTSVSGLDFGSSVGQTRGAVRYNNSTDSLSLYSAGSTALTIDSSGNVGIGDTTPGAMLTVGGNTGKDGEILVASDGGRVVTLQAEDTGNFAHVGSVSNHDFFLVSSDTIRMNIDAGGNIGIGTALAATPDAKLHIEGTNGNLLKVSGDGSSPLSEVSMSIIGGSSGSKINFGDYADSTIGGINYLHTNDSMYFKVNNSNRMVINSSGNVGIGGLTPEALLTVGGDIDGEIRVQNAGSTRIATLQTANSGNYSHVGSVTNHDFYLVANDTIVMGINKNGNVGIGIGTTAPVAKLQVSGGGEASLTDHGYMVIGATSGANIVMDTNEIQARNNGSAATLYLNPGSGLTETGGYLHVNGVIRSITGGSAPLPAFSFFEDANTGMYNGVEDGYINFSSNGSTKMIINPSEIRLYSDLLPSTLGSKDIGSPDKWFWRMHTASLALYNFLDDSQVSHIGYSTVSGDKRVLMALPDLTWKFEVQGKMAYTVASGGYTASVCSSSFGYGNLGNCSSSIRYKENIQDLDMDSWRRIFSLRPVNFDWKESGLNDIGLIAEDVETVMPELVFYQDDGEGHSTDIVEGVNYDKIGLFLISGLKELDEEMQDMIRIAEDGSLVVPADLTAENNLWGASSGWIYCPEDGSCSCPDGYYMTEIVDRGAKIKCRQL